jgi:hypothetical protein
VRVACGHGSSSHRVTLTAASHALGTLAILKSSTMHSGGGGG